MISCANQISKAIMTAAGSGGSEQSSGEDNSGKAMDLLREMLVPGLKKVDEDKMRKVKAILDREQAEPLRLNPMARASKKKTRPGSSKR